jgi:hypothetical protein
MVCPIAAGKINFFFVNSYYLRGRGSYVAVMGTCLDILG